MVSRLEHIRRLLLDGKYRRRHLEVRRLRGMNRHTPGHTNLLERNVEFTDAASFLSMWHDIHVQQVYRFRPHASTPYIIDGGANIGLSVIYFKSMWPQSTVIAFEPDASVFEVLSRNVQQFDLKGVQLVQKALWNANGMVDLACEGSDSGRLVHRPAEWTSRCVEAVRLRDYLDRPVDLLKLDIEGAETDVLLDCQDRLHWVKNLFVEYHSFTGRPQMLHRLLGLLTDAGFRLHLQAPVISPSPLDQRTTYNGMDLQVNVFGFREAATDAAPEVLPEDSSGLGGTTLPGES